MRVQTLRPVNESVADYERIEQLILKVFRELLYDPLIKELNFKGVALKNAKDSALVAALNSGRVTYSDGFFRGSFDAGTSRELKSLGAKWDKKSSAFILRDLPSDLSAAVAKSYRRFQDKLHAIDKKLAAVSPAEIAGKINAAKLFEAAISKTDEELTESLKSVSIVPKLTKAERKRVSDEWQKNLELYIEDFSKTKILKLRTDIFASVMAGNRYEDVVSAIEDSYEVTRSKAKFLARQETGLLMAKLKQVRYQSAGINEYKWGTRQDDRVRKSHKALEGKIFSWDTPPITTDPDDHPVRRCNPGQDYNCRCIAKPVVRFKGK